MADYIFGKTGAEIEAILNGADPDPFVRLQDVNDRYKNFSQRFTGANLGQNNSFIANLSGDLEVEITSEILFQDVGQVNPVITIRGVAGSPRNITYVYGSGGDKTIGFSNSSEADITIPITLGKVNSFKILQSDHDTAINSYTVLYNHASGGSFNLHGMVSYRLINSVGS